MMKGINASEGIGIGQIINYKKISLALKEGKASNQENEYTLFKDSVEATRKDLEALHLHAKESMGEAEAQIFEAHLMMLDDPEIEKGIKEKIQNSDYAVNAIQEVMLSFAAMFEAMGNDYMRERASDIRDIMYRLVCHAYGYKLVDLSSLPMNTILLADDLLPSETAQLNPAQVVGFITRTGGKTSHAAIMARTLRIPAVVGVQTLELEDDTKVIIDGSEGEILVSPDEDIITLYRVKQDEHKAFIESLADLAKEKTFSKDGLRIEIAANIGNAKDAHAAREVGAEGIGLFRTEFLFMDRNSPPSEDEQYQAYKEALMAYPDDKVVIRTLDIGGDKKIPYMDFPDEMNPFLGFRAIRYCLENEEIFRSQLRALLRASVHGQLGIMFPMIGMIEEIREAKEILAEEKTKLLEEGVAVHEKIDVGMMMEVPSAAVMAHAFASEVDFFSIGTNDLTQYVTACDRMNPSLASRYTPMQPAVIQLIFNIVNAAKSADIWVGMCGEAAGDPLLIPLWLAMGFDELSMSASSVLKARHTIKSLSHERLSQWIYDVMMHVTVEDVKKCLMAREW